MSIADYKELQEWISTGKKSGKYITMIRQEFTNKRIVFKSAVHLLDDMVKEIAQWTVDYSGRDNNDYVFGYGERQLDSILVPAFWEIVDWQHGIVLAQCPTERRKLKVLSGKNKSSETHKGWVDYRLRRKDTIHILEIKLASHGEESNDISDMISKWNKALQQLREIKRPEVEKLGRGGKVLFKTAILFIPIFKDSADKKGLQPERKPSYIKSILDPHLENLMKNFNPKPDWIAHWLLPPWLQEPWVDDDDSKKYWQTYDVVVFAKLCEKWKKEKGEWIPVSSN